MALPLQSGGLPLLIGLGGLAAAASIWLRGRRQSAIVEAAKSRLGEVEWQLNEAQSALQAESQILVTWGAGARSPERMLGSLHGAAHVPAKLDELINFPSWLEPDSADRLAPSLEALRRSGSAFNYGVKTRDGELLEVDGRAAGTFTTLRFRPLAGQRLEASENQYDAHKLARQVERLSGLLDAAPFPVWLKSSDGNLAWINRAYIEATGGASADDVLARRLALAPPDSIDASKAQAASHLLGRARSVKGGSKRAFNIHEVPQGESTLGYAVDVSGQEEAERELERYIKAQASTLNKLSTAIAIFGQDQRLRFHNQAYAQMWELEEAFLAAKPSDGEILDHLRQRRLLPEQANYREWRARQLSAYNKTETREDYWYLPDGRSLRVVAEQHPFGGITYLYDNLTKEHELERGMREATEVQRATLDNLAEAVALYGPDGRLRLHNPAFARFWPMDGAKLAEAPHVNDFANVKSLSDEARMAWQEIKFNVTGLESSRRELEGRFAQSGRDFRYRAVPLPDGAALVTFTDVSDAARAERALQDRAEALEAADQLKNSILTNVSYEVRTPLNSIIGFAEALAMGVAGQLGPKQSDYISAIRRSSEELKAVIDAIIDLSILDAGQMDLRLADVDVATLLEQSANAHLPQLEKKKLSIEIELAADVTTIRADEARLTQILGQLLSNAAGFSPPGAKIRMGARRHNAALQIWVADHGRGIDPDFQPRVFERFQAKPLAGSHRGPGLGLALVKGLVELHGGKVSLVSKLDQGTTVVCSLPLAGPAKPQRAHAA